MGTLILTSAAGTGEPRPNHTEVYAAFNCFGEAYDWPALERQQQHIVDKLSDLTITNDPDAGSAAAGLLETHQIHDLQTQLTIPYDPTLDVGDAVSITDEWLGLAAAGRVITALHGKYDRRRGIYTLALETEAAT